MYGLFAVDKRPLSHLSTGTAERTFNPGRWGEGLKPSARNASLLKGGGGGGGLGASSPREV